MKELSKKQSAVQAVAILLFEIALAFFVMPVSPGGIIICPAIFLAISSAAIVLLKNDNLINEIKALPVYAKVFAVLIDIRLAFLFWYRWSASDSIKKISANREALLLCAVIILALVSVISVNILFCVFYKLWNKYNLIKKSKPAENADAAKKTKKGAAITATVLTGVFWLSQSVLTLWETTDNYKISLVLNNLFSYENYCLFLNPVLASITKIIDGILPNADGFVLLTEVLMLVAVWGILYIVLVTKSKRTALIVWYIIVLANYDINLLHSAFTVTASVLAATGFLFVYSFIKKKVGTAFAFIGVILFSFGCMWRFNAALILIPYAGLVILADFINDARKKELSFKQFTKLGMFLLVFAIIGVGLNMYQQQYRSDEKYAYGAQFNSYRSSIYDYQGKPYDEIGDVLSENGISENDYALANELVLFDTEVMNADYLKTISEAEKAATADKINSFFNGGLDTTWYILKNSPSLYLSFIALSFCVFVLFSCKGCALRKLEMLAALAGTAVIILYFTFKGHLPKYLLQSIFIYCWLVIASIYMHSDIKIETDKVKTAAFLATVVIVTFSPLRFECCYIETKPISDSSLNAKSYEYIEKSETDLIDSDENAVFIWSVIDRNQISADYKLENSKLFTNDYLKHNILDGEWTYGQPYFNDLLSAAGVSNPATALTDRKHTYYVSNEERCDMILTYIQEHYYSNAKAIRVGEIYSVPVWEFVAE